MNYAESFNIWGAPVRQLPCKLINGAPTSATEGAVGDMCMDTNTGAQYKCTAVTNGVYTWVLVGEGGGGGGETRTVTISPTEDDIILGSMIIASGKVLTSNWYVCTDFIPVDFDEGSAVTVRCAIFGNASLVLYDSSKTVLIGINGTTAPEYGITPSMDMQNVTLSLPAGTAFVRMCALHTATSGLNVPYTKPDDFVITGEKTVGISELIAQVNADREKIGAVDSYIKTSDILHGKTLIACGDSITDAYDLDKMDGSYCRSYAKLVADRHGMTFRKNAVSGSTMAYNEGGSTAISTDAFSNTRYLNPPNFDYLTIWFGWNDAAYSTLGTIDDTDNTTFYGAYKIVIEYLITNHPTKKIGLIVPYGSDAVEPFAEAVREISQMYGVPCLDLRNHNQCSLLWGTDNAAQLARRAALTFDGTHPNQAGHEFLSTIYESFVKSL